MTKKKKYQVKKHQKRNPNKIDQVQTINTILVTLQQHKHWMTEVSRRLQGITYAFDSYLKFTNKEKDFNDFILERLKQNKPQENKGGEPSRDSSRGTKRK